MQSFIQIPPTFSYFFVIKEWQLPDNKVTEYLSISFSNLDDNIKFALEDYFTTESGGLDTMMKLIFNMAESDDQNPNFLYGNIYNLRKEGDYILAINPHDEYITQPCSFKIKIKILIQIMNVFVEQQNIFSKNKTVDKSIRNIK